MGEDGLRVDDKQDSREEASYPQDTTLHLCRRVSIFYVRLVFRLK
jgi:hypothetical protein